MSGYLGISIGMVYWYNFSSGIYSIMLITYLFPLLIYELKYFDSGLQQIPTGLLQSWRWICYHGWYGHRVSSWMSGDIIIIQKYYSKKKFLGWQHGIWAWEIWQVELCYSPVDLVLRVHPCHSYPLYVIRCLQQIFIIYWKFCWVRYLSHAYNIRSFLISKFSHVSTVV